MSHETEGDVSLLTHATCQEGNVPLTHLTHASAGALYLHVPFCVRKCAYCDFASWATARDDSLLAAYESALELQLRAFAAAGLVEGCQTAYVGGGTPTMLGRGLGSLVACVRQAAPKVGEVTCEANPDSLTDQVLDALAAAGATRVSIGVQSMSDAELAQLGRIHTAAQAEQRVRAAVAAGLDVSCDLMCAIPLQTDASWLRSLERVVALGVGHVSVYPLAIEEGTPLAARVGDDEAPRNSGDVQAARMEAAEAELASRGFHRYEVASYARPGKECHHNQAYWTGVPYLGLGTGASGMLTRQGYERLRTVCPQLPGVSDSVARVRMRVTSGREQIARDPRPEALHFDLELMDARQAAAEDLMLGCRMAAGVGPGLLTLAAGIMGADLEGAVQRVVERGLASWERGRLVPTHQGWLLGNELYGEMWDLSLGTIEQCSC